MGVVSKDNPVKIGLINFIKGFILGIANVIPGVSGGTMAVSMGLYELILSSIGNFFKDIKGNFIKLLPIILGILVAIVSTSKLVTYALTNYKAQTLCLFIGLIFGGVSLIMRKIKGKGSKTNYLIFFVIFFFVISLNFLKTGLIEISFTNMGIIDYLLLLLMGFIASSAMVIPGISGSFILMVLGYYDKIIYTISTITDFSKLGSNLLILVPFGIGVIIGIVFMAKLITNLIKKYETKTYFAIMGFVLSSVVVLLLQLTDFKFTFINVATSLFALCWGYMLARAIDKE
ncbi:putative uncharacterized protein [Mycoplasma sp. CAG:611]|nr:putative uncharacterized protein [Mycoplasma sp. CAG:611]